MEMLNYENIGKKLGYNLAKGMDWMDKKFHLFSHEIANGSEKIGLERKALGEGLRAVSLLAIPFIFSEVADIEASAMIVSDYIGSIANFVNHIERTLPKGNMIIYVRGIECIVGGGATALVASYKGSDFFYELGIATLTAGASLTCWASANYIERKR